MAGYEDWRQSRLIERKRSPRGRGAWNHLITVFVYPEASSSATAMSQTLSALLDQTYRNIEIVVIGAREQDLPDSSRFVGLRGLFAEPALDVLDILSDPAADHAWRGSHLVLAAAGTTFDPDTFDLLNEMLSRSPGKPALELVVCDHDRAAATGTGRSPCFLPGWDPDLIVAMDYIGTAFMASRRLVLARRSSRPASLHDWLRSLAGGSLVTAHLTEPVMHLPAIPPHPSAETLISEFPAAKSVAIIIPNRDKPELLRRCVRFLEFTEIAGLELVIVDHASTDPETLALYAWLKQRYSARILRIDGRFNFSRMVNLGVAATTAQMVLLLNNDIEVTKPHEIDMMVSHAMRPEVGVAGARLLYPDGRVQHAGVILRPGPGQEQTVVSQHVLRGAASHSDGYLHALRTVRNYQAVTGAIIATRRDVFDKAGGFDEVNLPVEHSDIDYCLRVRAAGFRVISLPTAGIVHSESSTRGLDTTPEVSRMRVAAGELMIRRWRDAVNHDPFRNPHLDWGDRSQALFPWTNWSDVQ
ncbi:glycosyltransferase [Mesorhizobium sp. B2-3-4]|uniref:glycosyltransferase n=1 Tax=Mesorhizobium sp. B2-3-4 TaxID=2589959 RepID=UPI0015E48061|nr:glycosyltransferase [Mesorhizobium sp. B2-3-4]